LIQRYTVKPTQVGQRYFECDDLNHEPFELEKHQIFPLKSTALAGVGIQERTNFFGERVNEVFRNFYEKADRKPDHLIHVTCTGYLAPSGAQRLVSDPSWDHQTDITHAYHMGCYASLPALRMAESFVRSGQSKNVDIVHTELCGLHMNPNSLEPEQLVVQSLFADGHIKYSVQSKGEGPGLKVLRISERLIPGTSEFMTWQAAAHGMQMTLSRKVPEIIHQKIRQFFTELAGGEDQFAELIKKAVFAIHPGGPRIIDVIRESLEISEEQVFWSRKVLFERGNMSSATLPHVWKEVLDSRPPRGTKIVSFAFGPGLTVFGAIFEVA